ncbi:MAG: Trm112 family protein, partial [Cellvibrionaceae bacterium]
MSLTPELIDLLACPSTGNDLQLSDGILTIENTEHTYPIVSDIPWLLPNPQNSLIDWSVKLNHFHQVLSHEIAELEQEIASTTSPATKERLEKLLVGKQQFVRTVFDLLTPIVRHPMARKSTYDSLSDTAPNTQNLLSYEANLYRDWVWGEEENNISNDIVTQQVEQANCKKLLVLGAGAGRLALDIHKKLSPNITVATDINPLLVLATQKIIQGNGLNIYEFPTEPRNSHYCAIEHSIAAETSPDNFHYIFSDATKPAFKKGAFDTVVTPWLIDIQPLELSHFLKQLNQYLSIGDQWINFGSLVFHQNRDALCYSIEEVKTIAQQQGFDIQSIEEHQIPYLKSPYNAGHRIE